ncbi:MAG TPA: HdeD family acid-resistance protein [Desulfobulbus sp.]|nr:HdeD family acid-resistance protein [Desulfobulbus sp.]
MPVPTRDMEKNKMGTNEEKISTEVVVVDLEELPRKWGWLLALGILMLVTGSIGLLQSVTMTLVTVLFFGAIIMVNGTFALVQTIMDREEKWRGKMVHVLLAVLYIAAGALILVNPVAASAALTLLLGGIFLGMGIIRIVYGFRLRKLGWKWIMPVVIGAVDILFAIILGISWPISGLWVIGIIVSIELLMYGWMLTFTALAVRKAAKRTN